MKVYRLENLSGKGVYRCDPQEVLLAEYEKEFRPMPQDDVKLTESFSKWGVDLSQHLKNKFVFCFESPEQLLKWFNKPDDLINWTWQIGIRVGVYEVPDAMVLRGDTQAAIPTKLHRNPVETYTGLQFLNTFDFPLRH